MTAHWIGPRPYLRGLAGGLRALGVGCALTACGLALAGCDLQKQIDDLLGNKKSSDSTPPAAPPPAAASGKSSAAGCTGTIDPTTGNDPLYPYLWYLKANALRPFNDASAPPYFSADIGQIKSKYTGCGIKVAVVDSGLEIAHEDLRPNVVPGYSIDFNTAGGTDPTPAGSGGDHGTSVAGLIGARANNGLGGRGVAGEASLVGYNFLATNQSLAVRITSLGGAPNTADVDVFNQSYGITAGILDPTIEAQLLSGVTTLRSGNGAVYVKSAGNSFQSDPNLSCALANAAGVSCQDASMDGENTTPYNIVVGALNAGLDSSSAPTRASYSTGGSALWIAAPGGETGADSAVLASFGYRVTSPLDLQPALVTTDLTGCTRGYSVSKFDPSNPGTWNSFGLGQNALNSNCSYMASFSGTSAAAPVVSGAVAVMLSANPALTWRDAKYILARTATQVDSSVASVATTCGGTIVLTPGWVADNGVGFHFHNWYGFGRVNLDAAVAMATSSWTPNGFGTTTAFGTLTDTNWYPATPSAVNLAIPDCNATGVTTPVLIPTSAPGFIEAVAVNVCIRHPNVGELQFELTLPGIGTSVLLPGRNGFNLVNVATTACEVLETNAFYGLASTGGFTLTAKDTVSGNTGYLDSWQVRVYGH